MHRAALPQGRTLGTRNLYATHIKKALLHELCSATTLFPLPLFPAFGAGGNIKEDLFMLSASADEQVLPASGELHEVVKGRTIIQVVYEENG